MVLRLMIYRQDFEQDKMDEEAKKMRVSRCRSTDSKNRVEKPRDRRKTGGERLAHPNSGWMCPIEIDESCDPIGPDESTGRGLCFPLSKVG